MTQQIAIPGTEPRKKRRSLYEQALVGDLVVAFIEDDGELKPGIVAIEQVRDGVGGDDIFDRWVAQGVTTDARVKVEVWEARPGFHFRKRKAGR